MEVEAENVNLDYLKKMWVKLRDTWAKKNHENKKVTASGSALTQAPSTRGAKNRNALRFGELGIK